jgi:alkylation response protein AidB-like acyl-CoA dehydrogenase
MDLDWTGEQQEFRAELRRFVEAHRRADWTHYQREMPEQADREAAIAFCRELAGAGLLTPHWPAGYGGREPSPWEQTIVSEELWGAGEPRASQYYNVNWIGPAIMAAGTPEQKAEHLGRMGRGEAMWCQGFSEPDAGSDLASLRTTAIRDGDVYVVNGQKIWTSYAHAADYIFLLARTDPVSKGAEGITVLLPPMDLPGIEVRNIPNPWVPHLIHEVWFTDVQVPVSCRLGEENEGWGLVRSVLANERIGLARHECAERTLDAVLDHATTAGLEVDDPGLEEAVRFAPVGRVPRRGEGRWAYRGRAGRGTRRRGAHALPGRACAGRPACACDRPTRDGRADRRQERTRRPPCHGVRKLFRSRRPGRAARHA